LKIQKHFLPDLIKDLGKVSNIVCKQKDSQIMEYISAPEAAKKWGISERRVQKL
jgi:hypothetical protein